MQDIHAVAQPAHTSAHATRSTHRAVTRLVVGELFLPPRATCVVLSLSHDTGPVQTIVSVSFLSIKKGPFTLSRALNISL